MLYLPINNNNPPVEHLLTVENISKTYVNHKALDDVSIHIPKQSIFGLLGPNGAGKTTLIRIINQIIMADKGEVKLNGQLLDREHIRKIGYLPEERGLYKKMKVGEQLMYLAGLKGLSKNEAKEVLKFWADRFEIGSWWKKNTEELSKGMQQKIQFIATVAHRPELIILDEPFSGFDPVNANLIKDEILRLRDEGATIIFSTHRMESVEELCDSIALIHLSKKVLDGSKQEIKDAHKTNTYEVMSTSGSLSFEGPFEVIKTEEKDNLVVSEIKIKDGASSNALLAELIKQTEVHSFIEKIPSINDIFIATVDSPAS